MNHRTERMRAEVARRCRVPANPGAAEVHLTQTGSMRTSPGGRWMAFSARQTLSTAEPRFDWRARFRFAGLPLLEVTDYLGTDRGGVVGRLFGLLPLFRNDRGADLFRGELARYLAELVWNPDAVLANPFIDWQALDDRTLAASIRHADHPVTVRFTLDEHRDITRIACDHRPMLSRDTVRYLPWFARCSDYAEFGGRRIPRHGEAGWRLDGHDFIYWRADLTAWGTGGARL